MPDLTDKQVLEALPEKWKDTACCCQLKPVDASISPRVMLSALRDLASLNTRVKNLEHGLGEIKEMTCLGTYGPCGQADNSAGLAEDYLDGTLP